MKSVKCPCCGKELFSIGASQSEHSFFEKNKTILKSDEHGKFMKCRHCDKRVVFATVASPNHQSETEYRVSDIQPCADC